MPRRHPHRRPLLPVPRWLREPLVAVAMMVGGAFLVSAVTLERPRPPTADAPAAAELRIVPDVEVLGEPVPIEDPRGGALTAFHDALRRVQADEPGPDDGAPVARVLFLGASHTASDELTGPLRKRLRKRFGDAGPGLVQPVEPFRWYAHRDLDIAAGGRWTTVRVDRFDEQRRRLRYPRVAGLSGFAVESVRPGSWARVLPRHPRAPGGRFSRIEVHWLAQPGGGRFDLRVDGTGRLRVATGARRRRVRRTVLDVPDGSHRVGLRVHGDGPVRILGMVLERDEPGVVVDAMGIPGSRAADQLPGDPVLHRAHLRMRDPDLVVLAWGTNEVLDRPVPITTYEADLRQMISRIRTAVPGASCLLVGPSDRPEVADDGTVAVRPRAARVIEVQRRLAAESGCGFFDLVRLQGGHGAMARWVDHRPAMGRDDHTHFTRRGYERVAELLERALLADY